MFLKNDRSAPVQEKLFSMLFRISHGLS